MKKIILLTLMLTAIATLCHAQVPPKPFDVYFGVGATFGSAPQEFTDMHKEGYHLYGGLGLNMMPMIQAVGKVEYHSFSKDFDEFLPDADNLDGATRRLLMIGADARLGARIPTAPISPFLFAGIGFARVSESDIGTALEIAYEEVFDETYDKPSETDFYFNIGGGVEFRALQVFNVFVQGKYVNIKQDGDNLVMIPITVGLKI